MDQRNVAQPLFDDTGEISLSGTAAGCDPLLSAGSGWPALFELRVGQ